MEVQVHIAGVSKLDDSIENLHMKLKETYQAIQAVHDALNDLGIEISQPAAGPTD